MPFSSDFDLIRRSKSRTLKDAKANANNALATATLVAPPAGHRNSVLRVSASFSAAPSVAKLLQVKSGTTVIREVYIGGGPAVPSTELWFDTDVGRPADNTAEAMSAELAASGTAGTIGTVYIQGFEVKDE